ncbi:MAG: glycosyltransferase [Desulfovibrionaceae bacterium]|nr:glycosyltransferase [Desulfovibrionaceae bacterium]
MNTQQTETIGVIVPAWNCANFLPFAIAGIMAQTRAPDRVLIVDDGSTDNTPVILRELQGQWPRLEVVRTENKGPASARNTGGAVLSDCDYLAFCDSDDLWKPEKLEKQMQVFYQSALPDLGCVYCGNDAIDEEAKPLSPPAYPNAKGRGDVRRWMTHGGPVLGSMSAVLIRKKYFDMIGGFNTDLRSDEDFEFFLRLSNIASFDYSPACLVRIRVHPGSSSHDNIKLLKSRSVVINLHRNRFSWFSPFVLLQRRQFLRHVFTEWGEQPFLRRCRTLVAGRKHYLQVAENFFSGRAHKLIAPHPFLLIPLSSFLFLWGAAVSLTRRIKYFFGASFRILRKFISLHFTALPKFLRDLAEFNRQARQAGLPLAAYKDIFPAPEDATATVDYDPHYLYHTAWAARCLAASRPAKHIDIGSLLYFSAIASAFCPITHYDYRRPDVQLEGLETGTVDLVSLPFADNSIASLSCMHVVEHIGLGRYGDAVRTDGDLAAMRELARVLAPGGDLFFVVPVGRPRVCFHAHRIYSFEAVINAFTSLTLREFALISGKRIIGNAPPQMLAQEDYGCGCFFFQKQR